MQNVITPEHVHWIQVKPEVNILYCSLSALQALLTVLASIKLAVVFAIGSQVFFALLNACKV